MKGSVVSGCVDTVMHYSLCLFFFMCGLLIFAVVNYCYWLMYAYTSERTTAELLGTIFLSFVTAWVFYWLWKSVVD